MWGGDDDDDTHVRLQPKPSKAVEYSILNDNQSVSQYQSQHLTDKPTHKYFLTDIYKPSLAVQLCIQKTLAYPLRSLCLCVRL